MVAQLGLLCVIVDRQRRWEPVTAWSRLECQYIYYVQCGVTGQLQCSSVQIAIILHN